MGTGVGDIDGDKDGDDDGGDDGGDDNVALVGARVGA